MKKDINVAMQERDKNSLNNLLLLKGELGCICIEFDYRYEAKGYEQVIKELKTDVRVNVGKEFTNLDNSISPIVRAELYDEATTWAIYDINEKGYLSEDGTLDIISEKEKQYNEEHSKETVKENACFKGK